MQRTDTSLDQYNDEASGAVRLRAGRRAAVGRWRSRVQPALPTAYPDARFPAGTCAARRCAQRPARLPLDRLRGFFVVETAEGSNANAACMAAGGRSAIIRTPAENDAAVAAVVAAGVDFAWIGLSDAVTSDEFVFVGGRHPARLLQCMGRRAAVCHADLEGLRAAGRLHGEVGQPCVRPEPHGGVRRRATDLTTRWSMRARRVRALGTASTARPSATTRRRAWNARWRPAHPREGGHCVPQLWRGLPAEGLLLYEEGPYAGAAYFGRGGTAGQEAERRPLGLPNPSSVRYDDAVVLRGADVRRRGHPPPFDVRRGFELAYRVDSKSQGARTRRSRCRRGGGRHDPTRRNSSRLLARCSPSTRRRARRSGSCGT